MHMACIIFQLSCWNGRSSQSHRQSRAL